MNIGSLSTNWLLYQTMIDISRAGQGASTELTNLNGPSFEMLLQQVIMQTGKIQSQTSHPDLLGQLLTALSSDKDTATAEILTKANDAPLTAATVDGRTLNSHLEGVLKNTGQFFQEAGELYQINPALLAAISMHETGNGTSNAARFKFNVAGMMGKNGLKSYPSIRDSIFDMARNLRKNYLDKGLGTITQIGAKYAPIGAANDPNQLNHHWVGGVQQFFQLVTK